MSRQKPVPAIPNSPSFSVLTIEALKGNTVTVTSSSYTVLDTDFQIRGYTLNNNVTIDLPEATGTGRFLMFKKKHANNNFIIQPYSGDVIDDSSSITLTDDNASVILIDGESSIWDLY